MGGQWVAAGVIVALIFGAVGAYYTARSQARENKRQRAEETARAVAEAERPLRFELAEKDRRIETLERRVEARENRIQQLEDERARGWGR